MSSVRAFWSIGFDYDSLHLVALFLNFRRIWSIQSFNNATIFCVRIFGLLVGEDNGKASIDLISILNTTSTVGCDIAKLQLASPRHVIQHNLWQTGLV